MTQVEAPLPELFLKCENCNCQMWIDPYTGLCVACHSMEGNYYEFRPDGDQADGELRELREGGNRVGEGFGHHPEATDAESSGEREDADRDETATTYKGTD